MTDHDDSEIEAAPTEQASPSATKLPAAKHAKAGQDESLDDDDYDDDYDDDDDSARRPRWIERHARVLVSARLVAIAGLAVIFPIAHIAMAGNSKHIKPDAKPSTSAVVNAPTSAPTAPLQSPTAVAPIPYFSAYDEKFLSLMTQEGWGCKDDSDREQCRRQTVNFAHEICSYAGQPIDLIYQNVKLPPFLGPKEENGAIAKAEQAYPNCTFTRTH
jgi:hypothetical protein